ncbi:hypothetical protein ABZS66_42185 [Dactylosporangium sp. NPDC005572]|uniref:hypothetical protein n=1 Tax=Dactylosporangium sp. NPDC005572 TaxID=3156889 RepID=UPI0033A1C9F3
MLYDENGSGGWERANPRLGGVAIRIRRSAPMWDQDGPMLVAAADSAIRLYRNGDQPALIGLAHAIAHRLFQLAYTSGRPQHPAQHDQNGTWNEHPDRSIDEPGTPQQRATRQHRPQDHEKGNDND